MNIVGKSARRPDAVEKVAGRAVYTGDLEIPGMAHGRVLPSPYPHARVLNIDASRARRLPGVYGVLTSRELADLADACYGSDVKDRPIVALEKVRYEGEPVAAVAAVDLVTAEEALGLIDVEYEQLPIVATLDDALHPGAGAVHESNLCHAAHYEWGDVERGFAEADMVFEDAFTFPMVYHYAMEPHTVIAHHDGAGITVWTAAQHPFLIRNELARIFGLPLSRVQVTAPYVGGGFRLQVLHPARADGDGSEPDGGQAGEDCLLRGAVGQDHAAPRRSHDAQNRRPQGRLIRRQELRHPHGRRRLH